MVKYFLTVMKSQIIKNSLIIWCFYLFLSTGLLGFDYLVRLKQGHIQIASGWVALSPDGIPIELHSGLLLILGGTAMIFLFKALSGIKNIYLRYSMLIFQSLVGLVVTLIIWFYYVTETGIDSL